MQFMIKSDVCNYSMKGLFEKVSVMQFILLRNQIQHLYLYSCHQDCDQYQLRGESLHINISDLKQLAYWGAFSPHKQT